MWLLLLIPGIAVDLLAFPMALLIVLFDGTGRAVWAWPWMTYDNPIDGDAGHWLRWPDNGTKWRIFCRRVAWLWRNRGYNFAYYVLGRRVSGPTQFWGDRSVSDNPMHAGWCFAKNGQAWELYAYYPWLPRWQCGLRVRLGWKLPLTEDACAGRVMMAWHINPFKGYRP